MRMRGQACAGYRAVDPDAVWYPWAGVVTAHAKSVWWVSAGAVAASTGGRMWSLVRCCQVALGGWTTRLFIRVCRLRCSTAPPMAGWI